MDLMIPQCIVLVCRVVDYTKNYLVLIKDINNKKLNKDDEEYAKYLDISNVPS